MRPYFYLAISALLLLMTGFRLFADGMFVDGVTYAAISRNLADGLGSFWHPHLSATLYPQFHEHPPLALGIQSLAFRIFGDHPLVERLYSLSTLAITGYLLVLIWNELTGRKNSGWLPLLFWILFPLVSWAGASNLLDNTLCIFTTLSILLILKSESRKNTIYMVQAGLALFAGLLTKGPFALFPWVFPFILGLSRSGRNIPRAFRSTVILILSTLIPLILLVSLSEDARSGLHSYWVDQVVGSLGGAKTVTTRFYIIGSLASQLILPFGLAGLVAFFTRKPGTDRLPDLPLKPAIPFLLLGLSGVLPIMISLKQSSFYILSALPAFALMIALPFGARADELSVRMNTPGPRRRILRLMIMLLAAVSLVLPPLVAKNNPRDREELEMIRDFSTIIPAGSTIRIAPELFTDWSLQSYFARLSGISLDPSENSPAHFYLIRDAMALPDTVSGLWTPVRQKNRFVLFQK